MKQWVKNFGRKSSLAMQRVLCLCLAATFLAVAPVHAEEIVIEVEDTINLSRIWNVMQTILQLHVDAPSENDLTEGAIRGMIEALNDPYTEYMTQQDYDDLFNDLDLAFYGIGAVIASDGEYVYIERVLPNSPAEEAGLQRNDKFISIDGHDAKGQSLDQVKEWIRGEEHSTVQITFERDGERFTLDMERRQVSLPELESGLVADRIGYVLLRSFSEDADELMAAQLNEWKAAGGLDALVLDLRYNTGGLLQTAANIAKLFVKEGILIRTRDRDGVEAAYRISDGEDAAYPIYLLVNEYSASASELLTGALQDYGKATVIGTQTYGKGSVQHIYSLSDGHYLKLTVERYLTPNGREVDQIGITPDVLVQDDMPQLLTAFHLAGVEELELVKDRNRITINDVRVDDLLPVIEEDGKLYVHSRTLAAFAGLNIVWNEAAFAAEFSDGNGFIWSVSPDAEGSLMKEGYLFISLDTFRQAYPAFGYSGTLQQLTMTISKGR